LFVFVGRATRCCRGGFVRLWCSPWPHGFGRAFGVPREMTRGNAAVSGSVRSLAIDSVITGMRTVRRAFTIGDDRPSMACVAMACRAPRPESHPAGQCHDDLPSSEGRVGGSLRNVSNDDRRACVVLTTSSVTAGPRSRRRWLAIDGRQGARKRASRGFGRGARSGGPARILVVRAATSAVGPRCGRTPRRSSPGCRRRRAGAPTFAVGRPPSSRGCDEPGVDGGPKPRGGVHPKGWVPARERTLES
jgi:hypothetical protein